MDYYYHLSPQFMSSSPHATSTACFNPSTSQQNACSSCSPYLCHVLIRHDAVRNPLQPPYDEGHHRVVHRKGKYFILDVNGREQSLTINRLKDCPMDTDFQPALRSLFS